MGNLACGLITFSGIWGSYGLSCCDGGTEKSIYPQLTLLKHTEPFGQYAEPTKPDTKGQTPCDHTSIKFPGKKTELHLPVTERALSGELWASEVQGCQLCKTPGELGVGGGESTQLYALK